MQFTTAELKRRFGDPLGGRPLIATAKGAVAVSARWNAESIIRLNLPYADDADPKIARIQCHRLVARSLGNAFDELEECELLHLVKTVDGCYCPRLVRGGTSLSRHAWGVAIDLNASRYPLGSERLQDARLVRIMARHGFACGQRGGGLWVATTRPDAMHWEYAFRG